MDLVFNHTAGEGEYDKNWFEKIAKTTLAVFKLNRRPIGLSINLVSAGRMRFLNKKYRGKNVAADGLSFPLRPPSAFRGGFPREIGAKKFDNGIIELGDIFICLSVIRQKAGTAQADFRNYLCLLTVHSILHLLGFDHKKAEEQKIMGKMEQKIWRKLK